MRRLTIASLLAALVLFLIPADIANATPFTNPPGACTPFEENQAAFDSYGNRYTCLCVDVHGSNNPDYFICVWEPVDEGVAKTAPVVNWFTLGVLSQATATRTWTDWYLNQGNTYAFVNGQPSIQQPGYLSSRAILWKWNASTSSWKICRDTGDKVNTYPTNFWSVGGATQGVPACGFGFYTSSAHSYIYNGFVGGWQGNWVSNYPNYTQWFFGAATSSAPNKAPPVVSIPKPTIKPR